MSGGEEERGPAGITAAAGDRMELRPLDRCLGDVLLKKMSHRYERQRTG